MNEPPEFDYETASVDEIRDLSSELPGLLLGEIPGSSFSPLGPAHSRGDAGRAIEAFFGIPPNSRPEADFPGAGIELKSVPLIEKSVGIRVDQRTAIAQINYVDLAAETWDGASVRKKLHILFVFFERLRDIPKAEWPIVHVALWLPDPAVELGIRKDWERVRDKVQSGLAHELSEGDGRILGPCTKGVDGQQLRSQPFNTLKAKPRAWALKPSFVLGIYEQSRLAQPNYELIAELSELDRLLISLSARRGARISELAGEVGNIPKARPRTSQLGSFTSMPLMLNPRAPPSQPLSLSSKPREPRRPENHTKLFHSLRSGILSWSRRTGKTAPFLATSNI